MQSGRQTDSLMLARKEDKQNMDWVREVHEDARDKASSKCPGWEWTFEQSWLMQPDEEMLVKVSDVGWQINEDGVLAPERRAYLCLIYILQRLRRGFI